MIKKLRRRFVCINMLIVTVMLIVILGMTVNMTWHSLEDDSLKTLTEVYSPEKWDHHAEAGKEDKAQKPGTATGDRKPSDAPATKEEKPEKEKKNSRMPTFTLSYREDGTLVAEGSDFYDLTDTAYLEKIMTLAQQTGEESGILREQSLRFMRHNSKGTVYSFMDISGKMSTLWNLVLACLFVGIIAFVGFLILSIFLARLVVKPVEKAWTQQQQFIADASHELKTPLTVIITGAELMEDPSIDAKTQQKCVSNILETSRRMRSLTEEMLYLAKSENMQKEILKETCNLSELLEDSSLVFEPLFFEKGLELEAEIHEGIIVKGNETQLRQLGELLLDNGQKYSLPGKTVLTLKKHSSRSCELTISNPADPISEEDLEKLFERFYRADPSRTGSGSYGLGLAIARSIAERHGGSIKAEQKDGRITFTVRLPICN